MFRRAPAIVLRILALPRYTSNLYPHPMSNVALWALQWLVTTCLVLSFIATPRAIRRTGFPRPVRAMLIATLGLCLAVGLIVPWWTGHARALTPLSALLVAGLSVYDSVTNPMTNRDRLYLVAIMLMSLTVAIGRFLSL